MRNIINTSRSQNLMVSDCPSQSPPHTKHTLHTLRHTHSQTNQLSGIHLHTNIESNFSEQEMHVNTQSLAMATRLSLTVCLRSGELGLFSFSWLLGDLVSMVIVALRPMLLLFRELVTLQLCRHAEIINFSISLVPTEQDRVGFFFSFLAEDEVH